MNRSLYLKLTLAFMLVAFLTAGMVAVFIRATSTERLTRLIQDQQREFLKQSLVDYYRANGSWNGIQHAWRQLQYQANIDRFIDEANDLESEPGSYLPLQGEHARKNRSTFGLTDANGMVLIPVDTLKPAGSKLTPRQVRNGVAVQVDNHTVGTIITARNQLSLNAAERQFLQRTTQALGYAILAAMLAALVMGILLARTLTKPLHALTVAAGNIAQGKLDQQVEVTSTDEIGQLAEAFNRMSLEVNRVNQLRRQMTADIAHDLRTPLTVVSGYIESMRDGVLKPTPERLTLIYTEINRLQDLVNDLRVLSQAEAGELSLNPQRIIPSQLLERAAENFQHAAGLRQVTLSVQPHSETAPVFVDEARMLQVLDNLISNALRYTPEGGRITLAAAQAQGKVEIRVQDTGAGISPEFLPHIFDRFQRGEASRHAEGSESGLGLSIVKAFVEAMGGKVWAESIEGAGTTIKMQFPAAV